MIGCTSRKRTGTRLLSAEFYEDELVRSCGNQTLIGREKGGVESHFVSQHSDLGVGGVLSKACEDTSLRFWSDSISFRVNGEGSREHTIRST